MSRNLCDCCHFPERRHGDSCRLVFIAKLVETDPVQRGYWDTGWNAGFNGEPEPFFEHDRHYVAGHGWWASIKARKIAC